ncbi:hypothetical protein QTP70_029008 [Hemibagrus guttatus]|uniref:Uncharacterized protein n=1 Tax=Hemibagrus guttatus TaxID=175788 RepID=A0AAE0RF45_9TELE|nr:hypothetical protein QTP70_029008 [Hemibagrus guttatus]
MRAAVCAASKFTSCVTETLQKDILGSEGEKPKLMDQNPTVLRAYQAQKERERSMREARNMEKNTARAAMRAHFRRKYQLPTNAEDSSRVQATGRTVVIPSHLKKVVQSKTPEKDSSGLLSVFQNLSFSTLHTTCSTQLSAVMDGGSMITSSVRSVVRSKALRASGPGDGWMKVEVDGGLDRWMARGTEQGDKRTEGCSGRVKSFEEIPHTGRNGWMNLLHFWKNGTFSQLHKHMEQNFNTLGPIYRQYLGSQCSVNILFPVDIAELFHSEGPNPRRMTLQPWDTHRETRKHSKGVFLKNGAEWRSDRLLLNREVMLSSAVRRFLPLLDEVARDFSRVLQRKVRTEGQIENGTHTLTLDPSPELFRFALEASCHVLYGERIGLFSSEPSQESERFIWAVEQMLNTTPPLLYVPRPLLRFYTPLWTQHATAWDHIFSHAERRIQHVYERLQARGGRVEGAADSSQFPGVLRLLMERGQLPLELIRANITELMAGGVDTVNGGSSAVCIV